MAIKELIQGRKVPAIITAAAATLALSACGDKAPSDKIEACPDGYTVGAKPLKSVSEAQQHLQAGVAKLRATIPANAFEEVASNDINPRVMGAVDAIFRHKNDIYLDVSAETRVDDVREAFCFGRRSDEVFFSPGAQAAIGALSTVGIRVEFPR